MSLGRKLREAAIVAGFLAISACSGQSCSCVEPIKGGFPTTERHENAIQLRATASMFEFLEANAATIVPNLLPTGSVFNVPPSCSGDNKVCCAMPAPMCRIKLDFKTLSLDPTPPNRVKMATTLVLETLDPLPVEFDAPLIGNTKCRVSLNTAKAGSPTMSITSDIFFAVNATTRNTELQLANTTIGGVDDDDLSLEGDLACTAANFLIDFLPFIKDFLFDQVAGQVEEAVAGATCMTCQDKSDCNAFATACTDGACTLADGRCVQSVGLEGRMNLGAMLSSVSPGLDAKMDILAALGEYTRADTGLSLGMFGGGLGAPHNPCVPVVPAPEAPPVPESKTFTTDVLPDGATPYHLGIGVHKSHLDTLGWAAFDAGALCLRVGTRSVALLSSQTISVIIPSLGDLVRQPNAPMVLAVRPDQPPRFVLGKGTFKTDGAGQKSIDDPLLNVELRDFHLDFYAFVDERYVRVMTLNADVSLPISLDVSAQGELVPLVGDLAKAFTRVTVTNSELLAEAPDELAKAFPMLLGVAGGQLGSALGPIALPDLMGIQISPVAVTSTDPDAEGRNQFLSIFANLATAGAARPRTRLPLDGQIRVARIELPDTAGFSVTARGAKEPTVFVDVPARTPGGQRLEHAWSVGGAGWSPYSEVSQLAIRHPLFWAQGHHTVAVRSRVVGEPADSTPVALDVVIDTIAPEGRFDFDPRTGEVAVDAWDRVSPRQALKYRHRVAGGAFSPWTSEARFGVGQAEASDIVVEVIDEVGNVGTVGFHGRTTDPSASGCDCDVSSGAHPSPGSALWAACGLVALLLRRRLRAGLLCLLVAGAGALGCNQGLGKGDFVSPLDQVGRWHDVALRDGTFHVSAYDDSFGDLVYARIHDLGQHPSWQYVDGIDPNASPDQPGEYRHGVSDPGPDVGLYTSIALTRGGDPRIAYHDATHRALKLALGPGIFRTHVVESPAGDEVVGLYAALSLDGNDVPSIAYMVTGLGDGTNGFRSELRVATARDPNPTGPQDWTITVVDQTRIPCAGLCPAGTACLMAAMAGGTPNGDPAISTCVPVDATCPSTCDDEEQACIGGACVDILPEVKAPELPEGTGLFTQALRAPSGELTLVYHDRAQGDLKLARQSGGSFTVTMIDGGDPLTDVGQFATARAAADGTLHVAYVDALADRLLYRTVAGDAPGALEVIDDGLRDDGPHPVGAGAALILDGDGAPRVVYQDQRTADTLQARRAGTWSTMPLETGIPGFGFFTRLVAEKNQVWVSQFVYDRQNGTAALGSLRIGALP